MSVWDGIRCVQDGEWNEGGWDGMGRGSGWL